MTRNPLPNTTKDFIRTGRGNHQTLTQLSGISPPEEETEETPTCSTHALVHAWNSLAKEWSDCSVTATGRQLDAVVASKGHAAKYYVPMQDRLFRYFCTRKRSTLFNARSWKYQQLKFWSINSYYVFWFWQQAQKNWSCCSNTFGSGLDMNSCSVGSDSRGIFWNESIHLARFQESFRTNKWFTRHTNADSGVAWVSP